MTHSREQWDAARTKMEHAALSGFPLADRTSSGDLPAAVSDAVNRAFVAVYGNERPGPSRPQPKRISGMTVSVDTDGDVRFKPEDTTLNPYVAGHRLDELTDWLAEYREWYAEEQRIADE